MLTKRAKKSILEWKPINERMITARFNSNYTKMTVIVCYGPTNDAEDEIKDKFFQLLQREIDHTPSHDLLIIMGDLNAKAGESNEGRVKNMGIHGCGEMNENGERLADLCGLNNLVIGGTIFPHRKIHKLTWMSPNGRDKNQIDHIIINGRWRHSLQDVIVRRGADVGSDHHLVRANIRLHLKKAPSKATSIRRQRYDIGRLKDPETSKRFSATLRNRFQVLGDIGDGMEIGVEDIWKAGKESYHHACEKILPSKRRKEKIWISPKTWNLIDKRRLLKERKESTKSERLIRKYVSEYSEIHKEVKRRLRQDKRAYYENLASEAEEAASKGELGELYRITRQLAGKFNSGCAVVKDKEGVKITVEEKQLQRWAEHFKEVLNRPEPAEEAEIEDFLTEELTIDCSPPTKEEIAKSLKLLKNNKAAGLDSITSEILKTDYKFSVDWLHQLFQKIWSSEGIPEDWRKGLIVKIPKKGDKTECSNWRGVTLLSVPSKVFCKIIHMRMSDAINSVLREEQAGFRSGVGCIDHIFTLRNILEQCIEWNSNIHINFIDFEKAFDSIHRDSLWKILLSYGCPEKFVTIIKLFYENFCCSVLHNNKSSDWFNISSGVRQGCVMSPILFLVAIDWVMRKTIGNRKRGIRWTLYSTLEDLDFADDIAILASSSNHLQSKTNDLSANALKVGLNISRKKTKTMQLSNNAQTIHLGNECIEDVNQFQYLGSIVSKDNATEKDITNRLQKARYTFVQLNKVWKASNIKEKTKVKIFNSNVLSVLLYGSECWRMTKADSHRLSVFQTSCLRKICKIYWPVRISNEALLERTKQEDILTSIKRRRWRWLGHVLRKQQNNTTRVAVRWTPDSGKRRRGRPRETWRRTILKEAKEIGKTMEEMELLAKDRERWKSLVAALRVTQTHGK